MTDFIFPTASMLEPLLRRLRVPP